MTLALVTSRSLGNIFSPNVCSRLITIGIKSLPLKLLLLEGQSDENKSSLFLPELVFFEPMIETGGDHDLTL